MYIFHASQQVEPQQVLFVLNKIAHTFLSCAYFQDVTFQLG